MGRKYADKWRGWRGEAEYQYIEIHRLGCDVKLNI